MINGIVRDAVELTVKFRASGAREMDWHLYTWGKHVKAIKPKDFNKRKVWKA